MRFFFLFSFSLLVCAGLVCAYANLPPIPEDPGEPAAGVPVPPPPSDEPAGEDGAGGGGVGLGANVSEGDVPVPDAPTSPPGVSSPSEKVAPVADGSAPASGSGDADDLPSTRDDAQPLVGSSAKWYYGFVLVLVVAVAIVIVLLHRRRERLPARLKKF